MPNLDPANVVARLNGKAGSILSSSLNVIQKSILDELAKFNGVARIGELVKINNTFISIDTLQPLISWLVRENILEIRIEEPNGNHLIAIIK